MSEKPANRFLGLAEKAKAKELEITSRKDNTYNLTPEAPKDPQAVTTEAVLNITPQAEKKQETEQVKVETKEVQEIKQKKETKTSVVVDASSAGEYASMLQLSWGKNERPPMTTMNIPVDLNEFFNSLANAENTYSYMIVVNILKDWKAKNKDQWGKSMLKKMRAFD